MLEITGIPGHHRASIAVHDPATSFLLTGDTVYPGRLYIEDSPAFVDSLDRLVGLAVSRQVTHVLGCHVEMTSTPGRDYPVGTTYQPDEAPWPMTVEQLRAVRDAATALDGKPGAHTRPSASTGALRLAFADQSRPQRAGRRVGYGYELMSLVCSRAHASGMNTAM